MSLINQMLRDLQQRRDGHPARLPAVPVKGMRRARLTFSLAEARHSIPAVVWVGICGIAGIVVLWGLSSWLTGVFGPAAALPVAKLPPGMVAVATAPQPVASGAPATAVRRTPPVPIDVPPPAPPLAYGSSAPVAMSASSPPEPAGYVPAVSNYYSDTRPMAASLARPSGAAPAARPARPARPAIVPRIPGFAGPSGRLHPDMLPGAVTPTNLALQKAIRIAAAAPPPVVTPYGQAEAAYREGRLAYEANRTDASLEALRRSLGFYPGHLPARELLADQLEMAGRTDEAFAQLKQGLTIAPDYAPFRKRAARMLIDRGDATGATDILIGGGLPRVEDDPELHALLAGVYLQLGESFLAAQTYRNLLVRNPQAGSYWLGLGDALAADGQADEARKAYRRAQMMGGLNGEEVARARAGSARL